MRSPFLESTFFGLPVVVAIGLSIIFATSGQLLFKFSAGGESFSLGLIFKPLMLAGFVTYGLSAILWLAVLAKLPLSISYPFVSINFILIDFASWFIFHEKISWNEVAGLVLIISGLMFILRR